jgi:hypothetical protein
MDDGGVDLFADIKPIAELKLSDKEEHVPSYEELHEQHLKCQQFASSVDLKTRSTDEGAFVILPPELIRLIAQFFNAKDLRIASLCLPFFSSSNSSSLVNKRWYLTLSNDSLWKDLCLREQLALPEGLNCWKVYDNSFVILLNLYSVDMQILFQVSGMNIMCKQRL